MPIFGPPDINKLKSRRDIKGLKKALKYRNDKDIRRDAAMALKTLAWKPDNDQTGVWYWIGLHEWAKCVAMGSLAVTPLLTIVKTEPVEEAIKALGDIGDKRAVQPLLAILQSESDLWRKVQPTTARALGQIGDARAIAPLIATLQDGYTSNVPGAAVEALVAIGAPAVKPLIKSLSDEHKYTRKRAAYVLGMIGDGRASAFLIPMLSEDRDNRETAKSALIKIGAASIQPLQSIVNDNSEYARKAAAEALIAIGGSEAIPPLMILFRDTDQYVTKLVDRALVEIGKPAVTHLCETLHDEKPIIRLRGAEILGEIADNRAVETLIVTVNEDGNPDVRAAAARALVQIGSEDAMSILVDHLLNSSKSWVREAMQYMQTLLGDNLRPNHVGALFWASQGEWDHCAEMGSAALPALKSILSTRVQRPDPSYHTSEDKSEITFTGIRKKNVQQEPSGYDDWPLIMETLARVDDPGSIPLLVTGLSDNDWRVRSAARKGLVSLKWQPTHDIDRVTWWLTDAYAMNTQLEELALTEIIPTLLQYLNWELQPGDGATKTNIAMLLMRPGVDTTDANREWASTQLRSYAQQCYDTFEALVNKPQNGVEKSKLKSFGSYYARLIATAASYSSKRGRGTGYGGFSYSNDTKASMDAVRKLCEIQTQVSNNLLHHLTHIKDAEVVSESFEVPYDSDHPNGMGHRTKMLSFERQRQIAAAELEKRGNPAYDLEIYMTEDCWLPPEM